MHVSQRFSISERTLARWVKAYKDNGQLEAKTGYQQGYNPAIKDLASFKQMIEKHNISTIDEIKEKLNLECSDTSVRKALTKIGFVKKNRKKIL